MLFRLDEYKIQFEAFKKLDNLTYPFTFREFWRRKLAIENETKSILDAENFESIDRKSQRERTINEEMKRLVKSPTELFN